MAYASGDDIIAAHGSRKVTTLADRDRDGTVDHAAVTRALDDASAEMDAYLGARYTVPVSPVPPVLRTAAVEIAIYRLANNGAGLSEDVRQRYDDAIRLVRDIAGGRADLPDTTARDGSSGISPVVPAFTFSEVAR